MLAMARVAAVPKLSKDGTFSAISIYLKILHT